MDDCSVCVPIITCLCQALLMSIIINIYMVCMKTQRDVGQRFYQFVTCRDAPRTTQQEEETEDQAEHDVPYAAVSFFTQREKAETENTEAEKETVYSDVGHFGWE